MQLKSVRKLCAVKLVSAQRPLKAGAFDKRVREVVVTRAVDVRDV